MSFASKVSLFELIESFSDLEKNGQAFELHWISALGGIVPII